MGLIVIKSDIFISNMYLAFFLGSFWIRCRIEKDISSSFNGSFAGKKREIRQGLDTISRAGGPTVVDRWCSYGGGRLGATQAFVQLFTPYFLGIGVENLFDSRNCMFD